MDYKLVDVIKALELLGRHDKAEYYQLIIPMELNALHGFSEEKVLSMTISEIEGWCYASPKPLKYEGWNFYWGAKAFADNDNRDD